MKHKILYLKNTFASILILILFLNFASATTWYNQYNNNFTMNTTKFVMVLNISNNTAPFNNNTHLNVVCSQNNCTDLRVTLDNTTNLGFWRETNTSTNGTGYGLWYINKTNNGTVNIHTNTSSYVADSSNGSNTFLQYHGSSTANYLDPLVISIPFIYETKARVTSAPPSRMEFGVSSTQAGLTNSIHIVLVTNDQTYYENYNSGVSTYDGTLPIWTQNQWYRVKYVAKSSTAVDYYGYDTTTLSKTIGGVPTASMGLTLMLGNSPGGTGEQEFSFIRQYSDTPPIWNSTWNVIENSNWTATEEPIIGNVNSIYKLLDGQSLIITPSCSNGNLSVNNYTNYWNDTSWIYNPNNFDGGSIKNIIFSCSSEASSNNASTKVITFHNFSKFTINQTNALDTTPTIDGYAYKYAWGLPHNGNEINNTHYNLVELINITYPSSHGYSGQFATYTTNNSNFLHWNYKGISFPETGNITEGNSMITINNVTYVYFSSQNTTDYYIRCRYNSDLSNITNWTLCSPNPITNISHPKHNPNVFYNPVTNLYNLWSDGSESGQFHYWTSPSGMPDTWAYQGSIFNSVSGDLDYGLDIGDKNIIYNHNGIFDMSFVAATGDPPGQNQRLRSALSEDGITWYRDNIQTPQKLYDIFGWVAGTSYYDDYPRKFYYIYERVNGEIWVTYYNYSFNYNPPDPTNLAQVNSSIGFWINYTWQNGTGNITNSYNVSVNGTWTNGSANNFSNGTIAPHGWRNITVWAFNSSGNGNLSAGSVALNTQIPNNAISISGVSISYSITEGQTLNIDADYADVDSDSGTFSDNATQWNVNSGTGVVSWLTADGDQGTYNWNISVVDGYGSTSIANFTVTVSDSTPTAISNLQNTTFNFGINWTWNAGNNAYDYDVQINGTDIGYDNTTRIYNATYSAHATRIISVRSHNHTLDSYSVWVNQTTTIPNNLPVLSNYSDRTSAENSTIYVDIDATDADNDPLIYSTNGTNFTDFNSTTGKGNWTANFSSAGVYYINFGVGDGYGTSNVTMTITITNIALSITSSTPTSPITTTIGNSQAFTAETNRSANYTWTINGTTKQTNTSVTSASYVNSTAGIGDYNVTLSVTDGIDTTSLTWDWNVTSTPTYSISGYVFDNNNAVLNGVSISNGTNTSTSNSQGYYQITGMINGTWNLTFNKTGFDNGSLDVVVNGGNVVNQNRTIYDNSSPSQVTGMANGTATSSTINILWTAATDPNLWGYQVFRNGSSLGYTQNTFYNDSGLNSTTTYQYSVRANDSYNNWGTNSSTQNVTTAEASADAYPTLLTSESRSPATVEQGFSVTITAVFNDTDSIASATVNVRTPNGVSTNWSMTCTASGVNYSCTKEYPTPQAGTYIVQKYYPIDGNGSLVSLNSALSFEVQTILQGQTGGGGGGRGYYPTPTPTPTLTPTPHPTTTPRPAVKVDGRNATATITVGGKFTYTFTQPIELGIYEFAGSTCKEANITIRRTGSVIYIASSCAISDLRIDFLVPNGSWVGRGKSFLSEQQAIATTEDGKHNLIRTYPAYPGEFNIREASVQETPALDAWERARQHLLIFRQHIFTYLKNWRNT